jgi:hypothetical protein
VVLKTLGLAGSMVNNFRIYWNVSLSSNRG